MAALAEPEYSIMISGLNYPSGRVVLRIFESSTAVDTWSFLKWYNFTHALLILFDPKSI